MSLCHELDIVHVDLEDTYRRLCSADDEIIRMCDIADDIEHKADKAIDELKEENDMLRLQLEWGHTPCQRKLPHRNSLSTSPSCRASSHASCHTSPMAKDHSHASCHPSPMAEDRDNMPLRDIADPPHLLSRLTMCSMAASSVTLLPLGELPQLSPVLPSPSIGADLASCMADTVDLAPPGDDFESTTPFIKSVSFYVSLPVLQFYRCHYKCTAIDYTGRFDYSSPFFVFADSQLTEHGPSFVTMLLHREFVQGHEVSIHAGIPLPFMNIILGGRNGVLISPHNPTNEAGITALLTTPSRHVHAEGYINCVWNTLPESHEECHQKALELWTELQDTRCKEQCKGHLASGGALPLPKEPSPHVNTAIWKKWL